MENTGKSDWEDTSVDQSHYDWSGDEGSVDQHAEEVRSTEKIQPNRQTWPAGEVQPVGSQRRSAVVPILIGLICLLSVVIVVGALIIFSQRNDDNPMDEAAVPASASSQGSDSQVSGSAKNREVSENNTTPEAWSSMEGNSLETCTELKRSFEQEYNVEIKDKDGTLLPWDYYISYCDGKWAQIATAEWGTGSPRYWDGDKWIEIQGKILEEEYGPGLPCYEKETIMAYNPSQKALNAMGIQFCEDILE